MVQIAILGTGMIGTSIGLALKDNPDVTIEKIVGYDRDKSNMRAAKKVGAVNTVKNFNGRLIGTNTDVLGFMRSLKILNFNPFIFRISYR